MVDWNLQGRLTLKKPSSCDWRCDVGVFVDVLPSVQCDLIFIDY